MRFKLREIEFEVDENGCHICTSHLAKCQGYPVIKIAGSKVRISRMLYEKKFGSLSKNTVVIHTCDNPECINVDHLRIGTQKDNIQDMLSKGRHCSKGRTLSDSQIRMIKSDTFHTYEQLGNIFNVSIKCISEIKRGITWKHISIDEHLCPKCSLYEQELKQTYEEIKELKTILDNNGIQYEKRKAIGIETGRH